MLQECDTLYSYFDAHNASDGQIINHLRERFTPLSKPPFPSQVIPPTYRVANSHHFHQNSRIGTHAPVAFM